MRVPRQFAEDVAGALRGVRWVVLLGGLGLFISTTAAAASSRGAGIAAGTIYLLAVIAYAARWTARRRAMRAQRPPANKHDQCAVLAAVYGPPADDPPSVREMCAAAIICAVHEGLTDKQIARRLDCGRRDVPILLGLVPPPDAKARRRTAHR